MSTPEFFVPDVSGEGQIPSSPDGVKSYIRRLHDTKNGAIDQEDAIDTLLFGKNCRELEKYIFGTEDTAFITQRYPDDILWDGRKHSRFWTPYTLISGVVGALNLTRDNTLYDLGAAYGRVPLFAGIVTEATCKGVEMVPERVDIARNATQRLGLDNVEMINANVVDVDFSDGDTFYLYAPFSEKTYKTVLPRLQDLAQKRADEGKGPVTIAAYTSLYRYANWCGFKREKILLPRNLASEYNFAVYTSTAHLSQNEFYTRRSF